uniref:Odorant binding protein 9 n=1 Tax=Liriomyza sativae TaxID=127406 RepID=A0A0X8B2Y5_LIRSA|nr:odorant binding protein 9 [Liriomyza sativae]
MRQILILIFLVVAVVVAEKFVIRTHEDAIEAHEACREEFNVPDEIFEQYLNYVFPEHRRTKCYMKCFVEKMGLFTVLNGFNEKNFIAQFTYKESKNLASVRHGLEKCLDNNEWESDNCTWVERVFSCWLKINRPVVRKIYGPKN